MKYANALHCLQLLTARVFYRVQHPFATKSFMHPAIWPMQNGIHNNIYNMLISIRVIECMTCGVIVRISGQHGGPITL
jgi:hypothetical protein